MQTGIGRKDRLIKERIHDPYMPRGNPEEPTLCPECGVVSRDGRWQWPNEPPDDAAEHLCPACQRIRDRVPAGILQLSGAFLEQHYDEIMRLMHNKVEEEKTRRPMKRIMSTERSDDGVTVCFTDQHLPKGVGEAIRRAYEGELDLHFTEEAAIVRAYWHRD